MTSHRSTLNGRGRRSARLRRLVTVAAISTVALPVLGAAAASAQPTQSGHFIWTAASSNITGDCTLINNGATNGQPGALLYVSPNFAPGGTGGMLDNAAQVAVYYDQNAAEWCIFNEDGSAMQAGQAFNVLAVPSATADAFQVTATASNSSGNYTLIDSAATNGRPKAAVLATPVYASAFENHVVGVWYDTNDAEWSVFNEDKAAMDTGGGAVYNVLVGTTSSGGGKDYLQKSTNTNRGGNSTHIDNAVTNGDPNAFALETPLLNPGGGEAYTYANHATGLWYQNGALVVFNEDNAVMANKDAFNVLMYNS